MTRLGLTQIILDHWMQEHPETARKATRAWLVKQATAQANLAMGEMQAIKMPGMTDHEAWAEVRAAFLTKPPTPPRKG